MPRREQFRAGGLEWKLGERSFNGRERNPAFRNLGGLRFEDAGFVLGIDGIEDGRGAVAADLTGDGVPDLAVNNRGQPARWWRHRGVAGRAWCTVRLRGRHAGNREAIGATVTCAVPGRPLQALPITAGTGYLSQGPADACFGLGGATTCTVTVRWPGGRVTSRQLGPGVHEIAE